MSVIAILIATPVLGIMISTIGVTILHLCLGHKFYINKPSTKLSSIILSSNDPLNEELETKKWDKKIAKKFYCKYQAYFRAKINQETIHLLARRWNYLWIHLHNVTAILLVLVFLCLDYSGDKNTIKTGLLYALVIGPFFYVLAGIFQCYYLRKEVLEIEERAIERNYYG